MKRPGGGGQKRCVNVEGKCACTSANTPHCNWTPSPPLVGKNEVLSRGMFLQATLGAEILHPQTPPDLPLASASSDMIGWSRVLLSHPLDAACSYLVQGAGISEWPLVRGGQLLRTSFPAGH